MENNQSKFKIWLALFLVLVLGWGVITLVKGCATTSKETLPPTTPTTDTTAPTITAVSPTNEAKGVLTSTNISATFSESIDPSTITTSSFTLKVKTTGSSVTGTVTYDATSKIATFDPSSNLEPSTTYEATISTAVKDTAGNALASAYSWSFMTASFTLTSSAFSSGGRIPDKYTSFSGKENYSPPLSWSNPPSGTQSFVLLVIDPDAPSPNQNFIHWLVINLPSTTTSLNENAPQTGMPSGSSPLTNDFGHNYYDGPSPPSGVHRYEFHLLALNTSSVNLDISASDSTQQKHEKFAATVAPKILAPAILTGTREVQ